MTDQYPFGFVPEDDEDTVDVGSDLDQLTSPSQAIAASAENGLPVPAGWEDPPDLVLEITNFTSRLFVRWNGQAFILFYHFQPTFSGVSSELHSAVISDDPHKGALALRVFEKVKAMHSDMNFVSRPLQESVDIAKEEIFQEDSSPKKPMPKMLAFFRDVFEAYLKKPKDSS